MSEMGRTRTIDAGELGGDSLWALETACFPSLDLDGIILDWIGLVELREVMSSSSSSAQHLWHLLRTRPWSQIELHIQRPFFSLHFLLDGQLALMEDSW